MGPYTIKLSCYQFIRLFVLILCLHICIPAISCKAQEDSGSRGGTIVLDPGHGGENYGAGGSNGTVEKEVTLALAKLIADRLQNQYRVLLTRNDDHDLPIDKRTALANHHKADLFISIHAGGAPIQDVSGCAIMYYRHPEDEISGLENKMAEISSNQELPVLRWNNIQLDHVGASRRTAETLREGLEYKPNITPVSVSSAPLYVLSGAAMPALLIEPFYLTHPESEKYFQDADNLARLANDIATGIAAALTNREP